MAVMSFHMKTSDGFEVRRTGAVQAEWSGIGWNDSSWELLRGLDVVEDLPPDAWPQGSLVLQPVKPTN
jgi:hypothetical protein